MTDPNAVARDATILYTADDGLTMAECIAVAMEIHRLAAEACRVANTATSTEVTDARD